jgi:pyruvate/2-oxoglutarate dehydrogenase complex dihydrolipoamide dehydrogenase (E3) component
MVGGGVIGVEMSQFYRRMGSRVTLVQSAGRLLPQEDAAVGELLHDVLEGEGVSMHYDSRATAVRHAGDGRLVVTISREEEDRPLEATDVFLATGRRPNTDDLGLETVGLAPGDGGFLDVDATLATAVEGVWAAGDVRGGPMYTHTSFDDYRVVASQLTGDGSHTTDRVVPYAVFSDPELGRVGMTEDEARAAGHDVVTARYDMEKNGKAIEIGHTTGFIKVVVDRATRQLLGATVLADSGAEIVHSYITLMNAEAPIDTMQDAVHIHPTLNEAAQSALTMLA